MATTDDERRAMILYHFTCPWLFWGPDWKSGYDPETGRLSIPPRDLLPSNAQWDDEATPAHLRIPVVWLTTSTETKAAEAPNVLRLRLTVRLSSTDRKLRRFGQWMRGYQFMSEPEHSKVLAHWWVYRGTIPTNRIIATEPIMGQRPWWELTTAEEAAFDKGAHQPLPDPRPSRRHHNDQTDHNNKLARPDQGPSGCRRLPDDDAGGAEVAHG